MALKDLPFSILEVLNQFLNKIPIKKAEDHF